MGNIVRVTTYTGTFKAHARALSGDFATVTRR
jgi:hypothetical protein